MTSHKPIRDRSECKIKKYLATAFIDTLKVPCRLFHEEALNTKTFQILINVKEYLQLCNVNLFWYKMIVLGHG